MGCVVVIKSKTELVAVVVVASLLSLARRRSCLGRAGKAPPSFCVKALETDNEEPSAETLPISFEVDKSPMPELSRSVFGKKREVATPSIPAAPKNILVKNPTGTTLLSLAWLARSFLAISSICS